MGNKFSFPENGYLPTPSPDSIPGADGNWYNSTGEAFTPDAIPANTADTYYAALSLVPGQSKLLKAPVIDDEIEELKKTENTDQAIKDQENIEQTIEYREETDQTEETSETETEETEETEGQTKKNTDDIGTTEKSTEAHNKIDEAVEDSYPEDSALPDNIPSCMLSP